MRSLCLVLILLMNSTVARADLLNPASPISPLNPSNPASPLNPLNRISSKHNEPTRIFVARNIKNSIEFSSCLTWNIKSQDYFGCEALGHLNRQTLENIKGQIEIQPGGCSFPMNGETVVGVILGLAFSMPIAAMPYILMNYRGGLTASVLVALGIAGGVLFSSERCHDAVNFLTERIYEKSLEKVPEGYEKIQKLSQITWDLIDQAAKAKSQGPMF